jgi:DNA-binding response OmpR family regulator
VNARRTGQVDCPPASTENVSSLVTPEHSQQSPADELRPLAGPESRGIGEIRPPVLSCGNLELRPHEYDAFLDTRRVGLTIREFEVLLVLVERRDRVVHRPDIYRRVWGGEMRLRERAVDVFVRKVRNKLVIVEPGWLYIHTHFGVGYRFTPERLDPGVLLS